MNDLEKRLSEVPEQSPQHLQRMRQHQEPHTQMRLHHLGFACYDIEEGISHIKRLYDVKQCSEPVFDPQQNAQVCMLDTANGLSLELIAGHAVESLLKQGICLYQVCYEVPDIFQSIDDFLAEGATLISEPKPATLFENRLVAFLNTKLGLIELLEASVSPLSAERANAGATPHRSQRAETLAITATFSAEPLESSLDFWMQELQYQAEVRFAPYNQVFQQLLDPSSLLGSHEKGVNVVLLRLEDWLNDESSGLDRTRQQAQLEKNSKDFVSAIRAAVERSGVPYLVCWCPASPETLADPHLSSVLERQEARLLDELADVNNVHCISSAELLTGYPVADYYDPHTDRLGHVPFTPAFFAALGTTLARRISALKRAPYKVIVLDCDNTLWKGVCGEDGALGVTIAPSYRTLQECMLKQHEAGMLLCLCSKNQEDDVFEVFDRHPEMLLTREHLTASRINWHAKSENLRSLADELNLGLESFIFVDDNPLECAEVGANCPEVLTLQLPAEPERIPQVLQHFWAFDRVNVTDEDRTRSAHYQQNLQREQSRRDALTFQEFLDQLDLKISISRVDASQLPRAAQLTHRTNQFNLTTIRRSEGDIQALCEQDGYECLVTEVRDRFGDYGLVGVMLFKTDPDAIRVDTFLLSCRALGRGVEHRMLAELGTLAQAREVDHVAIEYIRSPKNQPALDFLESQEAACKEELEDRTIFRFPSACAASIAFQSPERIEDDSQRKADRTQPAERQAAGEEQELLHRIAAELYDVDRILSAISARKHRARPELESQFVAPRTPVEESLANIWTDVLELDRVGVDDDFFQLGGHSLLATQVLSRIIECFQVNVSWQSFLQEPTIAGISAQIVTQIDEKSVGPKRRLEAFPEAFTIRAVSRDLPLPLSFAQERVWFFQQLEPESAAYNLATNARLTGPLNLDALTFGIEEIVRRHESLRTRFVASENGMPVQVVEAEVLVELPLVDLSALPDDEREAEVRRLSAEEIQTPFDLTQCPLFRFSLVRIQEDEHLLLATKHHIISDEWSSKVFLKELCHLYDAFSAQIPAPLPHLEIHSADFAYWQHQRGRNELFEKQLEYWTERLKGLPPMLDLPTDHPRPSIQHYRGASTSFMLSSALSESLKTLSRQEQGTLFMTFLAAFNVLLYRYSGSEDIAVGFPVANRNLRQLEPLIGFFVNTLVLRTNLTGELGFRELLRQTITSSAEAQDNQDLPFERIVAELHPKRELSHNPLFQVMFVWYTTLSDAAELADGLCLTPVDTEETAAIFDLTLTLEERAEGVRGKFIYNSDLFDEATIDRMTEHFRVLLEGIAGNPDRKIALLPLLPKSEEQLLLREWNRTEAAYPDQSCINHLFEEQVERNPNAVAVCFGEQQLSYRQLNLRASQVARYLRSLNLEDESFVPIFMERSPETVVAILGVLKAGSAYVPIDPSTPRERIGFILKDIRASVLITQGELLERLPAVFPHTVCLDRDWPQIASMPSDLLDMQFSAERVAYVIYTSGSTGTPKGVLISHRAVSNRCLSAIKNYRLSADDRALQFASFSFDVSVEELFPPLFVGATVVLREQQEVPSFEEFSQLIRHHQITLLNIPTAYWHGWVDELFSTNASLPDSLRLVIVGTEQALPEKLRKWQSLSGNSTHWINAYGPTETTITATIYKVAPGMEALLHHVPIGRPIDNTQIYLVDRFLQPVPIGVPGEILIGGDSLALGYLHQPELTAEAFVPHPFDEAADARLYQTGDLARYSPDGTLEFLGRLDEQIKLRGFRIEPGEIAARLKQHPLIRDAAVTFENMNSRMLLTGYLVVGQNQLRICDEICHVYTVAQKPELQEAIERVHVGSWPDFFLGDAIHAEYWKQLYEVFPNYQVAVVGQRGQVLAAVHALPLFWDGTSPHLPQGWDDAVIRGFEGHQQSVSANTLCILAGVVAEEAQGKGMSYELIKIMKSIAASDTRFEHAIVPVRPTLKASFPDMPLEEYCRKTREDGLHFDPWLRVHERLGGTILGLNQESQFVTGSVAQWEVWTGRTFERSGEYMIEGAMQPVTIDLERDFGNYYDLTVWFEHQAEAYQDLRFHDVQPQQLQDFLSEFLPDYMIPSKFIVLPSIPMTPGGKLDRQALPSSFFAPEKKEAALPKTPTEKRLADMWSEALDVKLPVGIHENFFEIGGHSLLATRMISKMSNAFQLKFSIKLLFQHPTIALMAKEIDMLLSQAESVEAIAGNNVKSASEEGIPVSIEKAIPSQYSPFLRIEQRPLLSLFAAEKVAPVDAVALSYLEPLGLEEANLELPKWFDGLPVLGGILETEWGRIGHILLPRLRSELYEDLPGLLHEVTDALKMAKTLGARAVSLTGLLPSATNYGKDIVEAVAGRADLPIVTNGHATTCATVVLSIKEILQKSRRELQKEHVAFIGLGSIGLTTLRLMLTCLPHPVQITLCDVYAKADELIKLQAELKGHFGFSGEVRIATSTAQTLPPELYSATLIVGATNVPDILDVSKIQPGTLLVDDSGPHCFSPEQALTRFNEQEDILFSEGGVLRSPSTIAEVRHIPSELESFLESGLLYVFPPASPHHITGCMLSGLLSAQFPQLLPTIGIVDSNIALQHYEKLVNLGFRAAELHFEGETLPESSIQNFCQRFATR